MSDKVVGESTLELIGATGVNYLFMPDDEISTDSLNDFAENITGEIEDEIKKQDFIGIKTNSWKQLKVTITVNVKVEEY